MSAEILHIVMALLGLGLGWYIKHQSIGVPQEILDAIKVLMTQRQVQQSHGFLKDIIDAYEASKSSSSGAPPHA